MLTITDKLVDTDNGLKHFGKAVIFVEQPDRPFNSKDIRGDFAWRRNHTQPISDELALEICGEALREYGIKRPKVKYSYKAGCGMCPCSPGFVVYDQDERYRYKSSQRLFIWVGEPELELTYDI